MTGYQLAIAYKQIIGQAVYWNLLDWNKNTITSIDGTFRVFNRFFAFKTGIVDRNQWEWPHDLSIVPWEVSLKNV